MVETLQINLLRMFQMNGIVRDGAIDWASLQAKGTNSTSFLTPLRKERSGASTLDLRRCRLGGLDSFYFPFLCVSMDCMFWGVSIDWVVLYFCILMDCVSLCVSMDWVVWVFQLSTGFCSFNGRGLACKWTILVLVLNELRSLGFSVDWMDKCIG